MTFKEAQEFVLTFGKYEDEALDDIASTDDGLLYLDWLAGEQIMDSELRLALHVYLSDICIQKELEDLHS